MKKYTIQPRGSDFAINEYANGFAIIHKDTGEEQWLGDGVDMFFTKSSNAISPGTKAWERAASSWLRHGQDELYEAYFPELHEYYG